MRACSTLLSSLAVWLALPLAAEGQTRPTHPDTLRALTIVDTIRRDPSQPLTGVTRNAIYTGKKANAFTVRELAANTSLNNTRQTLGPVPGLMLWEQDAGGLQARVSVRGLSPNRSWEFNTRQDGVDIASDPFGYPGGAERHAYGLPAGAGGWALRAPVGRRSWTEPSFAGFELNVNNLFDRRSSASRRG